MNRSTLIVSLLALCFASVTAPAVIINVPSDFASIQGAIDAAVNGDEVVVAGGIYSLTSSISFNGKSISVRSVSPSATTIEGNIVSLIPLFVFNSGEGGGSVLDGFIIKFGSEGIRIENSSPTIRNCTIISSIGNGLFATNAHGVMEDCTVMANFGNGMRIIGDSTIALSRCMFNGNSLTGMDIDSSDPNFTDCEFIWNDRSGLRNTNGNPLLQYCLFGGNTTNSIDEGGGLYSNNGSPQLLSCVLSGNQAISGGGIFVTGTGNAILNNCQFISNLAVGGEGGGANMAGGILNNCLFSNNHSLLGIGGGAIISNGTVVQNCMFKENISLTGGGLFTKGPVSVFDSLFIQNSGNGISIELMSANDNIELVDCHFIGNTEGGGLIRGEFTTVTNCVFTGNTYPNGTGGAITCQESPTFVNCTFSMNHAMDGGFLKTQGTSPLFPQFDNCIVWGNTSDPGNNIIIGNGTLLITFSNIQGGFAGTGNIDTDPLFVDADGPDNIPGTLDDDLRLLLGSPCISTGDTVALPLDVADLDGDGNTSEPVPLDLDGIDRLVGSAVDMGAYEDQNCPADITPFGGNGIVNIDDLVLLLNAFGGCGGCVGDTTPSPGNGAVNIDDLVMLLSAFGPCP